jgi:alanine racemase
MRTWAECSGAALRSNIRELRKRLGGAALVGVVKANAYGHGDIWASKILIEEGAAYLAVATAEEAIALRGAGISAPILIFGITPPELAPELIGLGLTQTVADIETAQAYSRAAQKFDKTLKCHLKLDTGMGRLGFQSAGDAHLNSPEAVLALTLPGLEFEGVYTHFATSGERGGETYTRGQLAKFNAIVPELERAAGRRFALRHAANSGAVAGYPEAMLDMARPGIMLYGYPDNVPGLTLTPVMELKTRIAQIKRLAAGDSVSYGRRYTAARPGRAAVLPIGYADGLPRALSDNMSVLINGKPARQIGTICMDMCIVDLTDIPEARAGDTATVFGREKGFTAEELAAKLGTISYELLCGVANRVPRLCI